MNLDTITPLILTYNEGINIGRCLEKLSWAKEIIVIDSYSEDNTLDILYTNPKVKIFQRKFDTHTAQWNYGLNQVKSTWTLSLDADYVLTDALQSEIIFLADSSINGYFIPFKYCVGGKPLRGTILPPRLSLFRTQKAIYIDDGHTQLLKLDGPSDQIHSVINHDDRKPLSRWLWAQSRYMVLESKKLLETSDQKLTKVDWLRKKTLLAPFVVLIYCLIVKGGILDGWRGWYYAFQRTLAEILLTLHLIERKHLQ